MSSIIKSSARSSLVSAKNSVFAHIIRREISTQQLDAEKGDRERVIILGSGWSGLVLSRELDKKKFQTVVVSPRPYFVFTPLLASTAVGTLEFRTTLESVRASGKGVNFFQGWADDVHFAEKRLHIEDATVRKYSQEAVKHHHASSLTEPKHEHHVKRGQTFNLSYDKLVIAVGCYSQTFGTPGVREHAFFLKDVLDARKIRKRILECFETAALPTTSDKLRAQLLNFAVVGGGPTGVEFAAELFDLCHQDLRKLYPSLVPHVKISIYDVAPKILPMFDKGLAEYAINLFKRDGIQVKTEHHISSLKPGLPSSMDIDPDADGGCFTLKTVQEGEIGVGMCVWSTGLMMNPFIRKALNDVHTYPSTSTTLSTPVSNPETKKWALKKHPKSGGLMVDDHFRVKLVPRNGSPQLDNAPEATMQDVFAIGDVSVLESSQLPATAQVANQEAKWLGKTLNGGDMSVEGFTFKNLGVMTYIGNMKAIMQAEGGTEVKGKMAWLIWRGAYLTQTVSWRNKLLIPIYWSINWVFGRDISRF